MDSFAVVGGEGFLGGNMLDMLKERYPKAAIASLDIVERPSSRKRTFFNTDLTDYASVKSALQKSGATTVFHAASPHPEAPKPVLNKVNIQGTRNIVKACQECGVKKLIFTSSAGVVFSGQDLRNVDERLTIPPVGMLDAYNISKYKAECIVLQANGKQGLLTCAIRPAGIFGPGDRQNIPGIIKVLKEKNHRVQLGSNEGWSDFTYVDNIVHAHLLAAEKLGSQVEPSSLDEPLPPIAHSYTRRTLPTSIHRTAEASWSEGSKVLAAEVEPSTDDQISDYDQPLAVMRNRFDQFSPNVLDASNKAGKDPLRVDGQAFFITNGEPVAFWDHCRAVWYAYSGEEGVYFPPFVLPVGLAWFFSIIVEFFNKLFGRPYTFGRTRVALVTKNRFYNIERARRLLGYEPLVGYEQGIQRSVEWFKQHPEAITQSL